MKRFGWIPIALVSLLLALAGCSEKQGAKGDTGPAGAAGEPATITVQEAAAEACVACHGEGQYADVIADGTKFHNVIPPNQPVDFNSEITDITYNSTGGTLTVTVHVTKASDASNATGLASKEIRLGVAKFLAAGATTSGVGEWVSYFKTSGALATTQTASDASGTFTDNGSGSYSYKIGNGLTGGSAAAKDFSADDGATIRVGVQVGTSAPNATYPYGGRTVTNGWWDIALDTGGTTQTAAASGPLNATGTPTNHVVDTASCNECHEALSMHGGGRRTVEYCEICHNGGNGGTAYANLTTNGQSIDFKVLLHKLHRGKDLPSVVAGTEYWIEGYQASHNSFSLGTFPQTLTNCEKCHGDASNLSYVPSSTSTQIDGLATLDNWKSQANVAACTSCHDLTSFAATVPAGYTPHSGGANGSANVPDLTSATCQGCHDSTVGGADPKMVPNAHPWAQQVVEANLWSFNVTSAKYASSKVEVKFNVQKSSVKQDITAGAAGSVPWKAGSNSRLRVRVATKEKGGANYTNAKTSDGADPGSPLVYDLLGTLPTGATLTNDGSNNYTLLTEDVSAKVSAAGTGMATLEGHPAAAIGGNNVNVPVISTFKEFRIGDSPTNGIPRRAVVDTARCVDCHGDTSRFAAGSVALSMHGQNRNVSETGGIGVCVACHNSSNTDVAGHDTSLDGLKEQAIDMRFMIHRIHKGGELEAGSFQIGEDTFAGEFPPGRTLNNCQNCHFASGETVPAYAGGGTFLMDANQLPLVNGIEGSTVNSGTSITDHSDDLKMSPNAATCSGCHDGDGAKNHMILMGASFSVKQEDIEFY